MGTARRLIGGTLVIASHNAGKLGEFAALLKPLGVAVLSAASLGLAEVEESGTSFRANARIKAQAAAIASGLPALGDDSGLSVAALDGQPGIHSARWAGERRDFSAAMERLERALAGGDDRRAWFTCALALCWPDGHCGIIEGRVDGTVVWPPRGQRGFGYDPVFQSDGANQTFAELAPEAKGAISHRARAFRKLAAACIKA